MIGERLNMLRTENNLTMKEMGSILGVTDGAINKYEKNKAHPSYEVIIRTADHFKISLDFLFGRTNIRNEKIIQEANIQSDFLKTFEQSNIGDIRNVSFLIANLATSFDKYNSEKVCEPELQLLLKSLSEIVLHFNTLADFKEKYIQINKEVFKEHSDTAVQMFVNLNHMLELIFGLTDK